MPHAAAAPGDDWPAPGRGSALAFGARRAQGMAIEILGELFITVGAEFAFWLAMTGPVREWRLDSFYKDLSDGQRRAFLAMMAAAVLSDGKIDEREARWIERRKEALPEQAALVDDALEQTRKALPGGLMGEAGVAFLAERAAHFTDEEDRERVFLAAAALLRFTERPEALLLFRDALSITEQRAAVLTSRLDMAVA